MEDHPIQHPQPKRNLTWLLWGVILLLLLAGAYFFISKSKVEDEMMEKEERLEEVNTQKDELTNEYNAALARLDQLTSSNKQLDSMIHSRDSEIGHLNEKIRSLLQNKNATESDLKEARRLIAQLESTLTDYQKQIGVLKQENIQLIHEKRDLVEENTELKEEKAVVENEKENVTKELVETKHVGSVLNASNIRMNVINKRKNLFGKEKESETSKARKADLMEIFFDLDVNRITESGQKEIYICITDPKGNVIRSTGNESGTFTVAESNAQKGFTIMKTVPYTQGRKAFGVKSTCVPAGDFIPGTYTLELYNKGYLIGSNQVKLK